MATVPITLPHHRYEIRIQPGLLGSVGKLVRQVAPHDRAALIQDAVVADLHGPAVSCSLRDAGFDLLEAKLEAGEQQKNLDTARSLYDLMLNGRMERLSPLVALGGGVVGDTAGFVAATFLRGVPFVQCPTTLLAMVDASVGGKVGVNVPQGKNLVGAFHQPCLVAIDTDTLKTLPARELRCGLAECVKHALIRDESLFDWIDQNLSAILGLNSDALVELVERNVHIKAAVVMADEKESGQRAHLNFGHTFAHAIEATQSYDSGGHHHGEAVALGMVAATGLAVSLGRCPGDVLDRLTALLGRIGLPVADKGLAAPQRLLAAMRHDKKVQDGRIRLVLPDRIGSVGIVSDVVADQIERAWGELGEGGE